MDWHNYHHLRYFWAVAREGGVTRASRRLHISQPTVSAPPRSLDGAPLPLPTEGMALRRWLDAWFGAQSIRPRVVGEFEDSALLKVFGRLGAGRSPPPARPRPRSGASVHRVGTIDARAGNEHVRRCRRPEDGRPYTLRAAFARRRLPVSPH